VRGITSDLLKVDFCVVGYFFKIYLIAIVQVRLRTSFKVVA